MKVQVQIGIFPW